MNYLPTYNKTVWQDRAVQFPNRYDKIDETSTQLTLIASPGVVTQAGTPAGAGNFNKIENGIETATPLTGTASTTNTGWVATTEAGFFFKKDIAITGVLSTMYPQIFFSVATYSIANLANVSLAVTYNGGVTLYATTTPSGTISFSYIMTKG